jgi:hypothetical protein
MHGVRVIGRSQQPVLSMPNQVWNSADVGANNTQPARHGLNNANRGVIDPARIKKDVAFGKYASNQVLWNRAPEIDGPTEPELRGKRSCLLEAAVMLVAADHGQARAGISVSQAPENADCEARIINMMKRSQPHQMRLEDSSLSIWTETQIKGVRHDLNV